jgi:hypothetical protein
MYGSAQPEEGSPPGSAEDTMSGTDRPSAGAVGDRSNGSRALAETELDAALQLLVERAQYITGATGTALALPQGEEMVCRASAGSSAPAVGARLQVSSGLTGESISRRQLLRCDNAEADPRVNLETCRALGIASIVVLPLLRRTGEVRGLFELFSDHPYAFEERDLIALERMAGLTLTALDLAEQRQASSPVPSPAPSPALSPAPAPATVREPEKTVESPMASSAPETSAIPLDIPLNLPPNPSLEPESAKPESAKPEFAEPEFAKPEFAEPAVLPAEPAVISPPEPATVPVSLQPTPASIPEAMLRVQKCAACGFPVSEGRTLCLDCEKKDTEKKDFEKKQAQGQAGQQLIEQQKIEQQETEQQEIKQAEQEQDASSDSVGASAAPTPEEFVPAFLANPAPAQESWLANHVNLLAIFVLILGVLVAVVVFR